MRIAVIADTHGRLPEPVIPALGEADEIWHLGDFCDATLLDEVRRIGPPVVAVRGNNDFGLDLPTSVTLERCGKRFFLIHIPPGIGGVVAAEFLLHGHTHVPRDEMAGPTRFLNPGSIGKADKGAPASYAWLTIPPKGMVAWQVVRRF